MHAHILKCNGTFYQKHCLKLFIRNYASLFLQEFDVSQFCAVTINCPCNIHINPIDVFKSQEKVLVNVSSKDDSTLPDIKCNQTGDAVSIDVASNNTNQNYTLNVETSVKASLNVCGGNNNIAIGSFYGKFIDVISNEGDINLSKSQCENISLITDKGNIVCKNEIQAGDIILKTGDSGKITTNRLQGLRLNVTTKYGHMNIGSSYCDSSIFETDFGHLMLENLHRNVKVKINGEGLLNIVGFDGTLNAYIKKGLADIQIARLYKDSQLVFEDPSTLILRLSEECQKENLIDILTKNYILSNTLKMNCEKGDDMCKLSPQKDNEIKGNLSVQCQNSSVLVDSASWSEIFKASVEKRT